MKMHEETDKLKKLLFLTIVFFLAFKETPAFSAQNHCTIGYATGTIGLHSVKVQAKVATVLIPEINHLKELLNSAKKRKTSIGDQLSKKQLIEFERLRNDIIHHETFALVSSNHARDADVVSRMYDVAKKEPSINISEKHLDIYQTALALIRAVLKSRVNDKIEVKSGHNCTVTRALRITQDNIKKQVLSNGIFKQALREASYLRNKYGLNKNGSLDRPTMSEADKMTYDLTKTVTKMILKKVALVNDLKYINSWWVVAEEKYNSQNTDILEGLKLGTTFKEIKAKSSKSQRLLLKIWEIVDHRDPSLEEQTLKRMSIITQKAKLHK